MIQSMIGTVIAKIARAHSNPLESKNEKRNTEADTATSKAKRIRPALESGVVLGSLIMKNAKMRNPPLCI